jgi:hypothetical protein
MYVGASEGGIEDARVAQGPNSGYLKYKSMICERCNSSVTQASDYAYDEFVRRIELDGGSEYSISAAVAELREASSPNIPLYRYFAKLLGCHLADLDAPIPLHLSRFVGTETDKNCIWLQIRRDPNFDQMAGALPDQRPKYAAHGGLAVITRKPKLLPSRLYSTVTIGSIQFIFYYVLTYFEILEMRLRHQEFIRRCATTARHAINDPIPWSDLERLGLI